MKKEEEKDRRKIQKKICQKNYSERKKERQKDEKIEELTDKLTRQMAEFDNFRKDTEKEKSQMYEDWSERYHREDSSGCRQLRKRTWMPSGRKTKKIRS